jgi:hypothetical protein
MSKEMKQQRLEKMIRDELEENNSDRQTPIQSLLPTTPPGAPGNGRSGQQDRSPHPFSPGNSAGLQY